MRTLAFILALAVLGGCTALTPVLDEKTGTTLAQRCVDYRGTLAAILVLQATAPTDDRAARINVYKALIETYCPKLPE